MRKRDSFFEGFICALRNAQHDKKQFNLSLKAFPKAMTQFKSPLIVGEFTPIWIATRKDEKENNDGYPLTIALVQETLNRHGIFVK